jgi:glycogen debranching enzyme
LRCLDWIDRCGDLDGDGFQEYKTFAPKGYHNQSWKDAGDALVYPDGRQVEQPIATCELQGYVFDAKLRLAELIEILGDHAGAGELRRAANKLKQNFNAAFWMETEGTYAFALDPDKQQVRSIASNPGHLLWSGIVDDEARARRVIERLLAPDMHSGWGIRTLSSEHPAYNPHSYQRGSVWPHDNALIAAGARRYGLWREANHIAEGILDACGHFKSHRLPELFAGLQRRHDGLPVQYVDANTPQAWASGSIFLLLRTILGIEADATHRRLRLQPRLPDWLPDVVLSGMQVGEATLSIRFSGHGAASRAAVIEQSGDVEIEVEVAAGDEPCDLS